jgi:hypothetical protein
MQDQWDLYWNSNQIGAILSPTVDNFFAYGPWRKKCSDELYSNFLHSLSKEGELVVEIRGQHTTKRAYLFVEPEDHIEVRFDPSLNRGPVD